MSKQSYLYRQKVTFTKWINSILQEDDKIEDLFRDLADGKILNKLLQLLSGEEIGVVEKGNMMIHKMINLNQCFEYLYKKRVRLENIGAEDIYSGNPKLILGLIWTIIRRFQIQEIEVNVDETNDESEKISGKDALLLWCQRKTKGYEGVDIQDFSESWKSGLAFKALIHSQTSNSLPTPNSEADDNSFNLIEAFEVADNEFGVPAILNVEDIVSNTPDEKTVMTYLAACYHKFENQGK